MPSGARQGWLIATGVMLALCLFAVWQSSLLALTDKLGPGPGFFPFWLSLIGSGFSLALLIGVIRAPADRRTPSRSCPTATAHGASAPSSARSRSPRC